MHWKRKQAPPMPLYHRLLQSHGDVGEQAPKGYVPVLVGADDECLERSLVQVELLKEPRVAALLEMAAQEYGFRQCGALRIPCTNDLFRQVMNKVSKEVIFGSKFGKKHIWKRCSVSIKHFTRPILSNNVT